MWDRAESDFRRPTPGRALGPPVRLHGLSPSCRFDGTSGRHLWPRSATGTDAVGPGEEVEEVRGAEDRCDDTDRQLRGSDEAPTDQVGGDEEEGAARAFDPGTEAAGVVVAELSMRSWRARATAAGSRMTRAMVTGRTCSQPRPLRLPVSHTVALWASEISARVRR